MKTIVITCGTAGIGRSVAQACLERGDRVTVVGASPGNGAAFLGAARTLPPLDQDRDGRRPRGHLRLVLPQPLPARSRAAAPPGTGRAAGHRQRRGARRDRPPRWDDLQLARGYRGAAALGHGGRLNDLLGAAYAGRHPSARIRYVLLNPGVVATSFAGEYDHATAAEVARLKNAGKPAGEAAAPVIACVDDPPAAPLSAFVEGRPHSVAGPGFDRGDAARLDRVTARLLALR